jgi:hypothetical protein
MKSNFIEGQTHYSTPWNTKAGWILMEPLKECSLIKPPDYLQALHQKLTEHGRHCMQNNQLPTKSHAELAITLLSF